MRQQSGTRSDRPACAPGTARPSPTWRRLYGPRIHQLAFRYLKNWEDAEEVAQDVLMKVLSEDRCLPRRRGAVVLDLPDHVQHGDVTAAQRQVQPAARSARARIATSTDGARSPAEPADWSSLADDQVMRARDARQADRGADAPAGRSTGCRCSCATSRGCRPKRRAPILRVKPQTLKSRLHRGRLILRQHLGDFAGGLESTPASRSTKRRDQRESATIRRYRRPLAPEHVQVLLRQTVTEAATAFSNVLVRSCRLSAGSSVFPTPPFTISPAPPRSCRGPRP